MIITVSIVNMMQPAINQIIIMIPMRHKLMPAVFFMIAAALYRFAITRVLVTHFNFAFIPMVFVLMMQVTVMYIINMISVLNFRMAALHAVLMGMLTIMLLMFHPFHLPA
jgi:hypothetical protein